MVYIYDILAITEGRGHARGDVGIASIDIKRPILTLCEISDSQTYVNTLSKINILNPSEVSFLFIELLLSKSPY